jgi:YEATS domain-containing protein 4
MLTPLPVIENIQPGTPFQVSETGWGEFEIVIKIYYVPEASEKPQTLYHHLRLHPYGNDAEKEEMRAKGEVISWSYEEQLFNEPNEQFYELLTNPVDRKATGGKGRHGGEYRGENGFDTVGESPGPAV